MTVSEIANLLRKSNFSDHALDLAAEWLAEQPDVDLALARLAPLINRRVVLNEDLNLKPQIDYIKAIKDKADKKKQKKGKK